MLMLPFKAAIPQNVKAYILTEDLKAEQPCFRMHQLTDSIPACLPVVVEGDGEAVFHGDGPVMANTSPLEDTLRGTFTGTPLYQGDYVLTQENGIWGFSSVSGSMALRPFDVYANVDSQQPFLPLVNEASAIRPVTLAKWGKEAYFDLQGRQLPSMPSRPGIYIYRSTDGKTHKVSIPLHF